MAHIARLPYRTPLISRIQEGSWHLVRDDKFEPLARLLPDWDPAAAVKASQEVEIDVLGVAQDCGLDTNARFRLAALWSSSGTMMRGCGDIEEIQANKTASQKVLLSVTAEGIRISQSIDFSICLVLVAPGESPKVPFAPYLPGCILWRSQPHRVLIEGEGPRFPVEVIDFTTTRFASDAGWALMWDSDDLHSTVSGGLRLYINSRHERVARAVSEAQPSDFDLREAIRYDIARSLIYGALSNDEFVQDPKVYEADTIGSATRTLLDVYFSGQSAKALHDQMQHPAALDHMIQSKLRVFRQDS